MTKKERKSSGERKKTYEVGDIVAVVWKDVHYENDFAMNGIDQIDDLAFTINIGEVVRLTDKILVISGEQVLKGNVPSSSIYIFPRKVIEEVVTLCPKKQYMNLMKSLDINEVVMDM